MYPLLKGLVDTNEAKIVEKVPLLSQFKGAHGISSVTSILIARLSSYEVEVCTVMTLCIL